MNTITPLSAIPGLSSSTSRQRNHQQQGNPDRQQGEILKALVVEARSNNRFVLDFGGTKITAASQAPLTVGQHLQLQVTSTTPQIELSIVSDFTNALGGKSLSLLGNTIDLADLLSTLQRGSPPSLTKLSDSTVQTLKTFFPSEQIIDISALYKLPTANLKSIETFFVNELHIPLPVPEKVQPAQAQALKSFLLNHLQISSSVISKILPGFSGPLETFAPHDIKTQLSDKEGGAFIQKLFNRLGINLENLLSQRKIGLAQNTLKASLLEVLNRFQAGDQVTEQASKVLATLELYQFAQLQLSQQNVLIFPLPFPFLNQGYLLIENYDSNEDQIIDENEDLIFFLHLSMTGLGNMKISFIQNKEELFIKFNMESKEKAEFLSQFQETLKNMVKNVSISSITFSSGVESPATELVRMLLPPKESILNTTA